MQRMKLIIGIIALAGLAVGINLVVLNQNPFAPVVLLALGAGAAAGAAWIALVLYGMSRHSSLEGKALYGLNTVVTSVLFLGICIVICTLGVAIMLAADAQKYFTLRVKRGLITDGMFRYVRHPNYLGEIMIYLALALMVWHWFPALLLTGIWCELFAVNMVMKEASMSRYPEWNEYKRRSWWLIPGLL